MTLLAAYKEQGLPILVGDFLITTPGAKPQTRKKICRVAPNLAVGWTGHLIAAEHVVGAMRRRFQDARPTLADLEAFLTSHNVRDLGSLSVTLVGWIVGSNERCFRWNSAWPTEVFYAEHHYAGSGAATYIKIAGEGGSKGVPPGSHPTRAVLNCASRLLLDELTRRANRAAGFGYAYEILYREGDGFAYVDDLMFVFLEVEFAADGRWQATKPIPLVYRYASLGEATIVQTQTFNAPGIAKPSTVRDLITPPFELRADEMKGLMASIARRDFPLSIAGSRICAIITGIRAPDTALQLVTPPLIFTQWPDDPHKAFEATFAPSTMGDNLDGVLTLQLPGREFFEWAFALIFKDLDGSLQRRT